ncbi:acyl-CoA dehydrogenase family protein [Paraburkholderia tropica]|uniref:acyl-CoA dehydrogenase family protein n=1 Tax=Paraburkholderia tropica TaxID=92647 RepID=UPI002AB6A4BC|nr:acyl-CoA dehydrogenase family protein [Paraburkholderia tropica]
MGGNPAINETSIAKVVCTESNFRCADEAPKIFGGAGYSTEFCTQMFFRDSLVGWMGRDGNEIQRNVLEKPWGWTASRVALFPGSRLSRSRSDR